jgi:hypothetical protein
MLYVVMAVMVLVLCEAWYVLKIKMKRILPSSTPFVMHVDLVHISSPVTTCTINVPNERTWECYIFLSHLYA